MDGSRQTYPKPGTDFEKGPVFKDDPKSKRHSSFLGHAQTGSLPGTTHPLVVGQKFAKSQSTWSCIHTLESMLPTRYVREVYFLEKLAGHIHISWIKIGHIEEKCRKMQKNAVFLSTSAHNVSFYVHDQATSQHHTSSSCRPDLEI